MNHSFALFRHTRLVAIMVPVKILECLSHRHFSENWATCGLFYYSSTMEVYL